MLNVIDIWLMEIRNNESVLSKFIKIAKKIEFDSQNLYIDLVDLKMLTSN